MSRLTGYLVLAAMLAVVASGLAALGHWSRANALDDLAERSQGILRLYNSNLSGHLSRFEVLPPILARDPAYRDMLAHPDEADPVDTANRHLEVFDKTTGALQAYIMDANGLTLAASNWNEPDTFVGHNFAFRPYFKKAMDGEIGRYFALGTTSGLRGYYFSAPIRDEDRIVGVAVVKADLAEIERAWASGEERIVVTDPDGVIFISSEPSWRYHTLEPLDPGTLTRIADSRRYPGVSIRTLPVIHTETIGGGMTTVTIRDRADAATTGARPGVPATTYLMQSMAMADAGWTVHILANMETVTKQVVKHVVLAALAAGLAAVLMLMLRQRLRWYRARIAAEQRTASLLAAKEETIRRANDELEQRVRERTSELWKANRRLRAEMEEREKTEEELRRAQDDLVQAGKLAAIGQLAAGVTHELNQPLTALRAYADNARILLEQGKSEAVEKNLKLISELTERVADISGGLKRFARRTRGEMGPVPLADVIASSLDLVSVGYRLRGIKVVDNVTPHAVAVLGERVRLEQVFVNLLRNAVEAVQDSPRKRIDLDLTEHADDVEVTIGDTGEGLSAEWLDRMFEPFFTTKAPDQGLGLGLSISYGIVADFGGALTAANRPEGGAQFTVRLRKADSTNTPITRREHADG